MKFFLASTCILFVIIFVAIMLFKKRAIDTSEDISMENKKSKLPSQKIINESKVIASVLSGILLEIKNSIIPNMTTKKLDSIAKKIIKKSGFKAAMKGYNGYPAATCISLNEQILHNIPSLQTIKEGDLITIQTAIQGKTAFANQGWTFMVGSVSEQKIKLQKSAVNALKNAIFQLKPGIKIGNISASIQNTIENEGYSVIREFVGFGMGKHMHQDPQIPCYGQSGRGSKIKTGMILNIQVIAAMGNSKIYISDDSWGAITSDHQPSVLISAMVLIEPEKTLLLSKLLD